MRQYMRQLKWEELPCVYADALSSAAMITTQLPFNILIGEERADHLTPLHWHDAFEIGYVLEGTGVFLIEGKQFPFHPGQVHAINDTDRHMAYAEDRARFFNVHFHPDLLRDASFPALTNAALLPFTRGSRRLSPLLPAGNVHTEQIIRLLQAIAEEHSAAAPHWPLAVKGLVLQIVTLLLRHFVDPRIPDAATLRRQELLARLAPALRLIEQRLAEPPSIAELADAVSLSPSRFSALFREAVGSAPVAYRNSRRVVRAQRLLLTTELPAVRVAEQSGFATVQQFNRVFRRATGMTPGEYRQCATGNSPPAAGSIPQPRPEPRPAESFQPHSGFGACFE